MFPTHQDVLGMFAAAIAIVFIGMVIANVIYDHFNPK